MFDDLAQHIPYHTIEYRGVKLCIKRLDCIHPQISGNKFFKLKYNLLQAQQQGHQRLLTFGGAFSNHIAATAYAAHYFGFQSIGIIRGEELLSQARNPTLKTAEEFGMQLHFVSRQHYREKQQPEFLAQLQQQFGDYYLLPEGGSNALAIQGCREILTTADQQNFDVICCAVGTGGTISGLIQACATTQHILGFSALKGDFLQTEIAHQTTQKNWSVTDAYCCGGYAKNTTALLQFITQFELQYQIPLEPIYTGKMLFGIFDLIDRGYLQPKQRILVIHSGGLQGKRSTLLPSC